MDRRQRSELSKKLWKRPGHRELQSEGLQEKWQDPDYREKSVRARRGRKPRKHRNKCENCGKTFKAAQARTRFCSPRCRSAWHRKNS